MLSLTIDSVFTRPERIMFAPKVWTTVLLAAVLALTLATEVSSGHSTMPAPGSHHGMIRRRGLIESILRGGEFGSTDAPAPTTTQPPSTSRTHTQTHKPSSSSSSSSDSGRGKTYEGEATHYQPGLGSCGDNNDASEMVVAVSHSKYDAKAKSQNPNENPFCGISSRSRMRASPSRSRWSIAARAAVKMTWIFHLRHSKSWLLLERVA